MQTFVPMTSFKKSAKIMDLTRLGKQIIEAQQIFKALSDPNYGWQSHPAVKMWRGHRGSLLLYAEAFNYEWWLRRNKGHKAFVNLLSYAEAAEINPDEWMMPAWWGNAAVHESHQANLVRKSPGHYRKFFPDVLPATKYVWPVQ